MVQDKNTHFIKNVNNMEKGVVLTEEQIGALAAKADESVDFREIIGGIIGRVVEYGDKTIFKVMLTVLNDKLLSVHLPNYLQPDVDNIVDNILSENWEDALMNISDLIYEVVTTRDQS